MVQKSARASNVTFCYIGIVFYSTLKYFVLKTEKMSIEMAKMVKVIHQLVILTNIIEKVLK